MVRSGKAYVTQALDFFRIGSVAEPPGEIGPVG
jgi:hypothetical protein